MKSLDGLRSFGSVFLFALVASGCSSRDATEIAEEFDQFVAERQECTSDDDCTFRSFECPLSCSAAFNKAHETDVMRKADELLDENDKDCDADCVGFTSVSCVDGVCAGQ